MTKIFGRIMIDLVAQHVRELLKDKSLLVTGKIPLVGDSKILDSLGLVELCLRLEELTNDKALPPGVSRRGSKSRSFVPNVHASSSSRLRDLTRHALSVAYKGRDKGRPQRCCRESSSSKRPEPVVHDALVLHNFRASRANQLWFTDITEHPTKSGKLYLCSLEDAFSGPIVGYSIGERMTSGLANRNRYVD
jgi:hypothetical protein